MINYFIFGITYSFACVIQPGPFQAFLFSQSISNGWRKTVPLVFAPLLSDLPVIILVLLVLTTIPLGVLGILQCMGGIFLLFLAYRAYKTLSVESGNGKHSISQYSSLLKAVMVNLFNPGPYLAWSLIMGPMLIGGWREDPINGIVLLTGFYGSMIVYSSIMVALFAAAGNYGEKINRISVIISVLAFTIFGFYQFWSGILRFL